MYGDIDGMIYIYEHNNKLALFIEVIPRDIRKHMVSADIVASGDENKDRVFIDAISDLTHLIKFAPKQVSADEAGESFFAIKVWSTKAGWES
jgi:hypothetical protein